MVKSHLKHILAEQLRRLMQERLDLDTQVKVAQRSGYSQSTIQRILSAEVHTSLDIVEKLAKIFHVAPLQLLEQIDKGTSDQIAPTPGEQELLLIWRKLNDHAKHQIMGFCSIVLLTTRSTAGNIGANQDSGESLEISKVPDFVPVSHGKGAARKPEGTLRYSSKDEHVNRHEPIRKRRKDDA